MNPTDVAAVHMDNYATTVLHADLHVTRWTGSHPILIRCTCGTRATVPGPARRLCPHAWADNQTLTLADIPAGQLHEDW